VESTKSPTAEDAATARRTLLGGLAQFAILAAAALRGGTEPDLLGEVVWWQTDDFWQYAMYAAVAYIRAAADRARVPVRQACQELAQRDRTQPG
jgi:hypothetical protein